MGKGLIKRVAAGKLPIAEIFAPEQEEFLKSMKGRAIDFARLAVLGPLTARRWQFEDPACPWPITAELWERADGERLMEVSIKVPAVQTAAAVGGFTVRYSPTASATSFRSSRRSLSRTGAYARLRLRFLSS